MHKALDPARIEGFSHFPVPRTGRRARPRSAATDSGPASVEDAGVRADAPSGGCGPMRLRAKLSPESLEHVSTRPILEPPDSTRMADPNAYEGETLTHRLILPRDANHHGTLYAGVLLSLSLEAGYATAFRAAGLNANLVLKRVLDLRCYEPVSVGRVVQIRGREIHRARAQIVVGLWGSPARRPDRHPGWTA